MSKKEIEEEIQVDARTASVFESLGYVKGSIKTKRNWVLHVKFKSYGYTKVYYGDQAMKEYNEDMEKLRKEGIS